MIAARAVFANVVAGRDLRTLLRDSTPGILMTIYLTILGLLTVVYLGMIATGGDYQSSVNRAHFLHLVSLAQLILILVIAPVSVAGSLVGERARGTWDLLIMTRLSAFHVIWGKSLAGTCYQILLLVAALPLYAVAYLFPGANLGEIAQVNLVLLATAVLAVQIGILVSLLSRTLHLSLAIGLSISVAISLGLTLLILGVGDGTQFSIGPIHMQPQVSRTAPLDPIAALTNSLPFGRDISQFGGLADIQHPLGLPAAIPLWVSYVLMSAILSAALLGVTAARMRFLRAWRT